MWKWALLAAALAVAAFGAYLALTPGAALRLSVAAINLTVPRSGYRVEKDLAYGGDPRQTLDLYIPDDLKAPAPVLLFFYGGSWMNGNKGDYLALGQTFASQGIVVAIADYRLYPKVHYPAFVDDAALALAAMRKRAAAIGGDPNRIFLAGHSAGAYNAVMIASDPRPLAKVHGDFGWIRGVIGIAGPYDFLPLTDKDQIDNFGGAHRVDMLPIHYIDGKRPAMLLVTGSADATVLPGNTARMAARLRSVGSEVETRTYPGVSHIGIILSLAPMLRSRDTLYADMLAFIAAH